VSRLSGMKGIPGLPWGMREKAKSRKKAVRNPFVADELWWKETEKEKGEGDEVGGNREPSLQLAPPWGNEENLEGKKPSLRTLKTNCFPKTGGRRRKEDGRDGGANSNTYSTWERENGWELRKKKTTIKKACQPI